MALYGIAIGITGDPNRPVFHLKTIKQKKSACPFTPTEPNIVDKFSFDRPRAVSIDNDYELKKVMGDFLKIVSEVVKLQAREKDEDAKRQVVVEVGIDGRQNYMPVMKKLLDSLFSTIKQRGASLFLELLNKINFVTGRYQEGVSGPNGELVESPVDLEAAWSLYQGSIVAQEKNASLEALRERILQGDRSAIDEACVIAREMGATYGYAKQNMDTRFALHGGLMKTHPKLAKLALFDFVSWHPDIKLAFRQEYARHQGSNKAVVVKGVNEPYYGPFVDIVACYIHDIFHRGDFELTQARKADVLMTKEVLRQHVSGL